MIRIAYLIVLVICLSFAAGSFILVQDMQRRHMRQFFVSYFYYVVCYLIFGLYSVAGYSFFQYMFQILDIAPGKAGAIISILLFFGAPFLITSWFMILKTGMEIAGRKISRWVVWLYFVISLLIMLVSGLILLYKAPTISASQDVKNIVPWIYIMADALSNGVFFAVVMWANNPDGSTKSDFLTWQKSFALLMIGGMACRNVLIIIQGFKTVHTLMFLLIFFASIFVPALYLRWKTGQPEFIKFAVKLKSEALTNFYSKYNISKREVDIILQICKGKSNQEIADALFISLQTVKDHTHRIYQKTGVNTRMQLSNLVNLHTTGT